MNNACTGKLDPAEKHRQAKKVYRIVGEIARQIDVEMKECQTTADLFTTKLNTYRQKLSENCEKIILTDPFAFGKKCLEVLWRKAYYETIACMKKFNETDNDTNIMMLIQIGVANFHHLIFKVYSEFGIQFSELDFQYYMYDNATPSFSDQDIDADLIHWTKSFVHNCLIYLGDLFRYQKEMLNNIDVLIPSRYYLQAANVDSALGMPYNQLGILYTGLNYNLDSVCYYLHCLSCSISFEGADGNLIRIFELNGNDYDLTKEKGESSQSKIFILSFLTLVEAWYLKKDEAEIATLCSETLKAIKRCLEIKTKILVENNDVSDGTNTLSNACLYKVTKICLFMTFSLKDDSDRAFTVKAFTLALYSQLLHRLNIQLKQFCLKNEECEKNKKKTIVNKNNSNQITTNFNLTLNGDNHANQARVEDNTLKKDELGNALEQVKKPKNLGKRRRRRKISQSETSDESDSASDNSDCENSEDEFVECTEDISDDENYTDTETSCDSNSADELIVDNNTQKNDNSCGTIEHDSDITSKNNLDSEGINKFLHGNSILPCLNILQDWILNEAEMFKHCGDMAEPIFSSLVNSLNIFLVYFYGKYSYDSLTTCEALEKCKEVVKNIGKTYKNTLLPEDTDLRGTLIYKHQTDTTELQTSKVYSYSIFHENVIRILKFMDFGFRLSKITTHIRFNKQSKIFFIKKSFSPKVPRSGRETREKRRNIRVATSKSTPYKHLHHNHSQLSQTSKGAHDTALMRNLGKLWLQNQVKELESVVRHGGRHHEFPLYLAIDSEALCQHTRLVKQLVKARKFVVLIPTIVLQSIDDLKKSDGGARDAIRWLENQLHKGSRFLRTQRSSEFKPIPFLKYPKKTSKATQSYIQIIEFCNYFIEEEKGKCWGGNGDPEATKLKRDNKVIVLLTGSDISEQVDGKELTIKTIASSGGVPYEHIVSFFNRWRQLTNKNGKKG